MPSTCGSDYTNVVYLDLSLQITHICYSNTRQNAETSVSVCHMSISQRRAAKSTGATLANLTFTKTNVAFTCVLMASWY